MRSRLKLAVTLLAVALTAGPVFPVDEETGTRRQRVLSEIHKAYQVPQDATYRLFRQPQPPPEPPIAGPVPEFTEAARLIVVQDGSSPVTEIVQATVDVTSVLVVVSDSVYLGNLIKNLRAAGLGPHLESRRIEVLEVETESIWIRDYGPVFARNDAGELVAVDSSYISRLPWGLERKYDDIVPVFLGHSLSVPTLRPPLILDGGNFATDSDRHCFTSTSTLLDNAGRRDWVDEVMAAYFGCRDVTYLEPLPGPTIKHIDMFFRVASDDTWLLGRYRPVEEIRTPRSFYQDEAGRRMERNMEVLAAAAGRLGRPVKILRVPMPDVYRIDDMVNAQALLEELKEDMEGGDTFAGERLDRLTQWSESKPEKFYVEAQRESPPFVYPTYLNYVHLVGKDKQAVLLPAYTEEITDGADPKEVRKILRQAYPTAEIRDIPSDELIDRQGALHCITVVVPQTTSDTTIRTPN